MGTEISNEREVMVVLRLKVNAVTEPRLADDAATEAVQEVIEEFAGRVPIVSNNVRIEKIGYRVTIS